MKNRLLSVLLLCTLNLFSQDSVNQMRTVPDYAGRKWLVGGFTSAAYGGSFLFLSTAWYKEYPRKGFHTFNDAAEWKQVDKMGHAWTTYHTSRITTDMWRWAGVNNKTALVLGTGTSLLYMTGIEYLDGHSADWGWSWADVGANLLGASLFAGQDLAWEDQRISIKFSAHHKTYTEPDLDRRANTLFGRSFQGRLLKDYNAQTYWISGNIKAFFPQARLPAWLNISIGYGAEGMFGGFENLVRDKDGAVTFDRRDVQRYRQWYLAPDIDLTRIKTKSRFLRTAFSALNVLKFPAPAVEFSRGSFRVRALAH